MTLNSPANLDLTHSNLGTEEVVRPTKLVVSCRSDFGCCVDESTAARYLRLQHASCTPPPEFLQHQPVGTESHRTFQEQVGTMLELSEHLPTQPAAGTSWAPQESGRRSTLRPYEAQLGRAVGYGVVCCMSQTEGSCVCARVEDNLFY